MSRLHQIGKISRSYGFIAYLDDSPSKHQQEIDIKKFHFAHVSVDATWGKICPLEAQRKVLDLGFLSLFHEFAKFKVQRIAKITTRKSGIVDATGNVNH